MFRPWSDGLIIVRNLSLEQTRPSNDPVSYIFLQVLFYCVFIMSNASALVKHSEPQTGAA